MVGYRAAPDRLADRLSQKDVPNGVILPILIDQILPAHRSAKTIYAKPVDLEDKPRFLPWVMPRNFELRCLDRC